MARPGSAVGICNISQDFLGQQPITSIMPGTTPVESLYARHYDLIRQGLLRQYPMPWSKRRMTLLRRPAAPEFDYPDAYPIPKDVLHIRTVSAPTSQSNLRGPLIQDYDIEDDPHGGLLLLCNNAGANSLYLRYIADITDVLKMDPLFVNVLAINLALSVAFQITKNKEDVARLDALLAKELPMLMSIAGQETVPVRVETSKFITARQRLISRSGVAGIYTTFDQL